MANKKTRKIAYQEPADFFPPSVRKAAKIGEYAETSKTTKKAVRKTNKKK